MSVLTSWLRPRRAFVVVGGTQSEQLVLRDMVYQGTVLGPCLWNLFFGDVCTPVQALGYTCIVYADDLNSFRSWPRTTSNHIIVDHMKLCQSLLHQWGRDNQVVFDQSKESLLGCQIREIRLAVPQK